MNKPEAPLYAGGKGGRRSAGAVGKRGPAKREPRRIRGSRGAPVPAARLRGPRAPQGSGPGARTCAPAQGVRANLVSPRPILRGRLAFGSGALEHGRFLLAGAKKAPRKGRWEMRITGRPYRSSGGAPPAAFRSHSRGRPSSDPGRSCSWGRG